MFFSYLLGTMILWTYIAVVIDKQRDFGEVTLLPLVAR